MDHIVTLTPEAGADPMAVLAHPPPDARLVELRADLLPDLDTAAAAAACPVPLLFTLRSSAEGGRGPDDPVLRERLLRAAWEKGAALLDLEYGRDLPLISRLGIAPEQVILSWHDPTGTPRNLLSTLEAMLSTPARLVKLVPTALRLTDLGTVLEIFRQAGRDRHRVVAFAMGTVGIPSRYLAPLLGAPLAYLAWRRDAAAAPGQLSGVQLEAVVGHLEGPPDRLYGVIGRDVSDSLSPVLHAAGFRHEGLSSAMVPISVPSAEELAELFVPRGGALLERAGLVPGGWAVTTPYKAQAAAAATLSAPRVRRARAANTLILRGTGVIAENTDADGVVGSLTSHGLDPAGLRAVVQGTGGAARGAAVGLDLAGASVKLRGRYPDRTREVAQEIGVDSCPPDELPEGTEILVNATPLGRSSDDPSPFEDRQVATARAVVDMIYARHVTRLAELAEGSGCTLIDGREMLLHQGFAQFAAFTGRLPPKEAMRAALLDRQEEP